MRHIRMLGLGLIAALATAALMASSAFALPEFGKCEAKAGGKYSDANCQVKAAKGKGTHEWVKATALKNKKFRGEGGTGILNVKYRSCEGPEGLSERTAECEAKGWNEGALAVECETEAATGEVHGTKEVNNIEVRFKGCKVYGSTPCSNTPIEGEIDVNPLKGTLGYINKAKKEVGIDLNPKTKKGEFAKFNCAGIIGTVVGTDPKSKGESAPVYPPKGGGDGIISPITPVNTMTTKYTQTYTTTEEDENIPNKFEGKPLQVLESYGFNAAEPKYSWLWSKSGEVITNVNTLEPEGEEGEIKA